MNNELRVKILKEMVKEGISLVPMHYCPDGYYTDYDDWHSVEVDGKYYDINFYSDGEKFYFTAYHTVHEGEYLVTDYKSEFHILVHDVVCSGMSIA
jgi:hypothetical protein